MATEQIYIWDGTNWIPLNTGGDDTHTLPVSSADGTVVLDSPAADTFMIHTGGKERFIVDEQGRVGINAHSTPFTPSYRFHINEFGGTEFFASGQYFYARQDADKETGFFWLNNQAAGGSSRSIWGFALDAGGGDANGLTLWASSVSPTGDPKWTFTKDSGIVAQNANGYLQTGAGTAAAPSVSYIGDTSTGTYSPAAGTWAVSTNGEERLRVHSAGTEFTSSNGLNKFVLTTGNLVGAIDVDPNKQVSDTAFGIRLDGDYKFYMWDTGNVFIGDGVPSAPSIKLTVDGDARFNGHIRAEAGIASLPSYAFDGDTSTGTFSPASGTWAVSTGGVERLRVRSDGNVGIGVAGAANILIDGKTDQAFLARLESTNDYQTGLYDGRCGYRIGNETNGPLYCEMYVDPTARTYGFGGSSSGGSLPIIGGNAQADIVVAPKNSVTFNSKIFTPAGTVAAPSVAIFGDEDTGTFSPGANQWAVSTGGVERLRIDNNGRVGVGHDGYSTCLVSVGGLVANSTSTWGVYVDPTVSSALTIMRDLNTFCSAPTLQAGSAMRNLTHFSCYYSTTPVQAAKAERQVGFGISGTFTSAADENIGFLSSFDVEAGKDNWAILCQGTAPSYFKGQVQTGLGTAAAPSLSYFGDTDTGTFSPAADTWAVSTGGVERLRVASDGKVGINTTTLTQQFNVKGTSQFTGDIRVQKDGNSVEISSCIYIGNAAGTRAFNWQQNLDGSALDLWAYDGAAWVHRFRFRTSGALRLMPLAAAPADPLAGEVYYDFPLQKLRVFDGTAWVDYLPSAGGTMTGPIVMPAGTASAPSVSIFGDEDTGTFSPGANTWAVSTGGVERLRVKSTGGVRYAPLASAPATPEEGEVYFDSTTKKLRVYNGTAWADLH